MVQYHQHLKTIPAFDSAFKFSQQCRNSYNAFPLQCKEVTAGRPPMIYKNKTQTARRHLNVKPRRYRIVTNYFIQSSSVTRLKQNVLQAQEVVFGYTSPRCVILATLPCHLPLFLFYLQTLEPNRRAMLRTQSR